MIDVQYLRHTGTDLDVVNAAKVSFHAESEWEDDCTCAGLCNLDCFAEFKLSDKDASLIDFLARHKHKSPFNHCFVTFRVKAPIFVARQLVKHEYLPWNEVSRRYVEGDLEFYTPPDGDWRSQPANVKQGSGAPLDRYDVNALADRYGMLLRDAERLYQDAIDIGLSREQARMFLPQSLMTEWVWSGSLYAFAKMCQLRLDSHAQREASYVAQPILENLKALFPVSTAALMKHGAV
jgi:thymidylate synthase (FAD)